jgi:hypothetical protein
MMARRELVFTEHQKKELAADSHIRNAGHYAFFGGKALDNKLGSIHLQGIGRYPAIPAGDLKVGDVIVYNQGGTTIVRSKRKVSAKTIEVVVESQGRTDKGKHYTRQYRVDRLVAVERKK